MSILTPTVDTIVSRFTKMVKQLDVAANDSLLKASKHRDTAREASDLATDHEYEAKRALQIKSNLEKLLGDA